MTCRHNWTSFLLVGRAHWLIFFFFFFFLSSRLLSLPAAAELEQQLFVGSTQLYPMFRVPCVIEI